MKAIADYELSILQEYSKQFSSLGFHEVCIDKDNNILYVRGHNVDPYVTLEFNSVDDMRSFLSGFEMCQRFVQCAFTKSCR